jgi:hypothetical protein
VRAWSWTFARSTWPPQRLSPNWLLRCPKPRGHSGLGAWSVRELVGHTSTAISGDLDALDQPVETELLTSPEAYYAFARTLDPAVYASAATAIARGHADALGADPAATIRRLVDDVTDRLGELTGDSRIQSAAGGLRLTAWLPTRTLG